MSFGLITSASYINPEMAAEFGVLPPSFLPIGNSRLFNFQARMLSEMVERVYISLPESYSISGFDKILLDALNVNIVRIPDNITLSESVMLAVIEVAHDDEEMLILHGDTHFLDMSEFGNDLISVHHKEHPYPWAIVKDESPLYIEASDLSSVGPVDAGIVSGMFSFSHSLKFLKCLSRCKNSFIDALNLYAKDVGLSAKYDESAWLDFGHLNTYYDSRRMLTTQRAFNELNIKSNIVTKTSQYSEKVEAEAEWFESVPFDLKAYMPAYLGKVINNDKKITGYRLDYEYLCPLNDLYVFGELSIRSWHNILESCFEFLEKCKLPTKNHVDDQVLKRWFSELYQHKTETRLAEYAKQSGMSISSDWIFNDKVYPSATKIFEEMLSYIDATSHDDVGVMHGDFCFSNILYDFRRRSIKVIDPRGFIVPGEKNGYGDVRYDMAKLFHSVMGMYDFIMAGYFKVDVSNNRLSLELPDASKYTQINDMYLGMLKEKGYGNDNTIAAITVLLFMSMLPLHYDRPDKQAALFANAYRLYSIFFDK